MGAISHMNQLYRENMEKKRTSRYNKKSGGRFAERPKTLGYTGKLSIPELSFQEKQKRLEAIARRNREAKKRTTIGLTLGVVLAVAVISVVAFQINSFFSREIKNSPAEVTRVSKELYFEHIILGDRYLVESKWSKAVDEYRRAIERKGAIDLKWEREFEAEYKLSFALLKLCELEYEGCHEAYELINTLEIVGYHTHDIEELWLRWEGIQEKRSGKTW